MQTVIQKIPIFYAASNTSDTEVWNSALFDQIEKFKDSTQSKSHTTNIDSVIKQKPARVGLRPPPSHEAPRPSPLKKSNSVIGGAKGDGKPAPRLAMSMPRPKQLIDGNLQRTKSHHDVQDGAN